VVPVCCWWLDDRLGWWLVDDPLQKIGLILDGVSYPLRWHIVDSHVFVSLGLVTLTAFAVLDFDQFHLLKCSYAAGYVARLYVKVIRQGLVSNLGLVR